MVEKRLQPTEIIGLRLEKGGEKDGLVWAALAREPQQEADSLSHMAVWISPVNFTSQFYILSLHITRKGHSVLKVGRSDLVIQSTNIY